MILPLSSSPRRSVLAERWTKEGDGFANYGMVWLRCCPLCLKGAVTRGIEMTFENGESQALVCRVRLTCHYLYVGLRPNHAPPPPPPTQTGPHSPSPLEAGGYVYFLPISLCIWTRVFPPHRKLKGGILRNKNLSPLFPSIFEFRSPLSVGGDDGWMITDRTARYAIGNMGERKISSQCSA